MTPTKSPLAAAFREYSAMLTELERENAELRRWVKDAIKDKDGPYDAHRWDSLWNRAETLVAGKEGK